MRTNLNLLLFLAFLILAASGATLALWLMPGRPLEQGGALAVIALGMWLGARNTIPPHLARMMTDMRALTVPILVVGAAAGSAPVLIVLAWEAVRQFLPGLPRPPGLPGTWENVALLAVASAFAFAVTRSAPPGSAMGRYPRSWKADFPEPNFDQRLDNLAQQLRLTLDFLDREASWSPVNFIPLEAEVEVVRPDGRTLEVRELYAALERHAASRVFLLLGDPGAGKSVALRNLARQMLDRVQPDGRLPVYVNLKEWRRPGDAPWTERDPPTAAELQGFILESLRRRIQLQSHEFLDAHFDALMLTGRLFLLLDSFDEIPALMDAEDPRWLVRGLSEAVAQVMTCGEEGRGLVASRLFRRPDSLGNIYCQLDIRPFSEAKAFELIDKLAGREATGAAVREWVMARRPDLAVAARNPFLLGLLIDFAKRNPGREPGSQYALYESFLDHSIAAALRDPDYRGLLAQEIREVTERIAFLMFETERFGLEMPPESLEAALPGMPVARVTRFLQHARLGRFGLNSNLFSFTHRRFNEFFLVRWFLEDPERVWLPVINGVGAPSCPPIDSTIGEGRWRDALVLYAQVAPDEEAERIAAHCVGKIKVWQAVGQEAGAAYTEGLQALRFMAEAFRGRTIAVASFDDFLAEFVEKAVFSDDILVQKHATEALGLVASRFAGPLLQHALGAGGFWVRETAFRACRYLPDISPGMIAALRRYLLGIPASALRRSYRELDELFTVVEPFRPLRRDLALRVWEARLGATGLVIFPLVSPLGAMMLLLIAALDKLANGDAPIFHIWQMRKYLFTVVRFLIIWAGIFFLSLVANHFSLPLLKNFFPGGANFDIYALKLYFPPAYVLQGFFGSKDVLVYLVGFLLIYFGIFVPFAELAGWAARNSPSSNPLSGLAQWLTRLTQLSLVDDVLSPFLAFAVAVIGVGLLLIAIGGGFGATVRLVLITCMVLLLIPFILIFWVAIFRPALGDWRASLHDRALLRNLGAAMPANRNTIAVQFMRFRSATGRLRYVQRLEAHASSLAAALSDPEDRWPGSRRPNFEDEASSRLARLDERWLGLSR